MNKLSRKSAPNWISLAVLLGLAIGAGWTIVSSAREGSSQDRPGPIAVTPTPEALAGAPTIDSGLKRLEAESPAALEAIRSIEQGNFESYVQHITAMTRNCDELATRSGSRCDALGVPAGTEVTLFEQNKEPFPGFLQPRQAVEDNFTYLTEGREPRIGVLARRSDGAISAVVLVEPKPGLNFPDRVPLGGEHMAIFVTVAGDGTVLALSSGLRSSPPLEWLQDSARRGKPYEVLGASDEFNQWVKEQHESWEAFNRATATP